MTDTTSTVYLKDYKAPAFSLPETSLRFCLHETHTDVYSSLTLQRQTAGAEEPLLLHAEKMEIVALTLDGADLPQEAWTYDGSLLRIESVPDQFVLGCHNRIKPQDNTSLNGLYKSRTMYCSQCEPHGFRCITPYLDRPDVLSRFSVRIEADKTSFPILLSNGNSETQGDLPEGRHFAQWSDPFLKPSYLFALVAGDLEVVTDSFTSCSGRDIELRIYVEPKDLDKVDHAMLSLKQAMRWDEETYGREYDLDLFMIVAVDDFNMGAMENKGLNIFNTSAVLANPEITTDARFQWIQAVVGHEYFHNWSGNRVTCRDWFQLSLKEGFTVYRDSQFSADHNSPVVARIEDVRALRAYQFTEDSGPLAHPVQPRSYQEINNFYTMTVYEKGAEVVRMQANLLGRDKFRQATDLYFDRFDGKAVTIEDFVGCMTQVSGLDMTQFMNWYRQAGTPVVAIEDHYDAAQQTYRLRLQQSCPATPESPHKDPFVIPVKLGLVGAKGDLEFTNDQGQKLSEAVLSFSGETQEFEFSGVSEAPIPSLLRGFSAPVKWSFNYSNEQLAHLALRDSDGFNRWDAMQILAARAIEEGTGSESSASDLLLQTARALLAMDNLDKAMIALMIQLPSMEALMDSAVQPDLDSLYQSRSGLRKRIGNELRAELSACYGRLNVDEPYEPSADQIANRLLKNTALAYWVTAGDTAALAAAKQQYSAANNMTDRYAALSCLVNSDHADAQNMASSALTDFYQRWSAEALVVNQWLAVQALCDRPGGLARVEALLKHEAFDIRNPNKVRSLIGSFCSLQPQNFHNADGSGYRFLVDQVLQLDKLNPQTASRMVNPLTRWKRFDAVRSAAMKDQLMRLQAAKLSPDLRELVEKSLA